VTDDLIQGCWVTICFIHHTYHHLQEILSVNAPPIKGPTTDARANVAERTPVAAGRYFGRVQKLIMIKQPANVPAAPVPVIARPAMKVLLFCDTASQELVNPIWEVQMEGWKAYHT
jgi:hypothetical protein